MTIKEINKEIGLLRSFVIGIAGKDKEGEYNPEFVKKLLRSANDKISYEFTDRKEFLNLLRSNL